MTSVEIPLFPLNVVLFPGGTLPLRIFEPRYLTMVGECMRENRGFGVVLLDSGEETGKAASFHSVGTIAHIVDFDQLDNGMLGITGRGGDTIHVQSHRLQPDQLIIGEVEVMPPPGDDSVPQRCQVLVDFLARLLQRDELQQYRQTLTQDWDSAAWLSCRLAELLPLTLESKQLLLESDPIQRLDTLHTLLEENQLLPDDEP